MVNDLPRDLTVYILTKNSRQSESIFS